MAYTKTQLQEMTRQAAIRYGINPAVALAQINQESGFNPNARSPQGAMGIAQFMPGTWAAWGSGSAYDPVAALDAYGRHMAHLLSVFGGDYRLALAGYHSGEGAARAALANPAGNPRTNNYVSSILAAAGVSTAPAQPGPSTRPGQPQQQPSALPGAGVLLFFAVGIFLLARR